MADRADHLHAAEEALSRAWSERAYIDDARHIWAAVALAEVALAAELRAGELPPPGMCVECGNDLPAEGLLACTECMERLNP